MGRLEIVEKLNTFLSNKVPFNDESEIVYLFVEIRKILDHDNNRIYPLLRFYADWLVHTEKDHITQEMHDIMSAIYSGVEAQINSHSMSLSNKPEIIGFMYMEDLQAEMMKFLQEYSLPDVLAANQDNWLPFVSLLVQVLADQPINNPCAEIKKFSFLPAAHGCVRGRIDFTQPIKNYSHYNFGNAY